MSELMRHAENFVHPLKSTAPISFPLVWKVTQGSRLNGGLEWSDFFARGTLCND